jgi:hypothetical protein
MIPSRRPPTLIFITLLSSLLLLTVLLSLRRRRCIPPYTPSLPRTVKSNWHLLPPLTRRLHLVDAFDGPRTEETLGLRVEVDGGTGWESDVEAFRKEYLQGLPEDCITTSIRTSNTANITLPRRIYTTSPHSSPHHGLPPEFHTWSHLNPAWRVEYFSDDTIRRWLSDAGVAELAEEWERLERGVLKGEWVRGRRVERGRGPPGDRTTRRHWRDKGFCQWRGSVKTILETVGRRLRDTD